MRDITGKKCVVVGGTHGMGRAVAGALIAEGADVLITGRGDRTVAAAREEFGSRARVLRSDAADPADIGALGAAAERELGRLDFVHVNLGVAEVQPLEEVTEKIYDTMFDINAKGAFFTAQHLAPLVREGGSLVFTTAVTNLVGTATMSVYAGTKAAVLAFAKAFAAELLPRGIRVNTVAPGFIDTPTMGFAAASAEERSALMEVGDRVTPMRRHGTVSEIAAAVLFLGFEATFTTGVEMPVDGGLGHVESPVP